MKLKGLDRNRVAIALAVFAGTVMILAPVAALFAIWQQDIRWLYTSVAMLVLAGVAYFLATQLFDDSPVTPK